MGVTVRQGFVRVLVGVRLRAFNDPMHMLVMPVASAHRLDRVFADYRPWASTWDARQVPRRVRISR